jgi:hypothetical protein
MFFLTNNPRRITRDWAILFTLAVTTAANASPCAGAEHADTTSLDHALTLHDPTTGDAPQTAILDELADAPRGPWTQGTWTFQSYGSGTIGTHAGALYSGHIGVGYHPLDNVSINLEAVGRYFNAFSAEPNGEAGGLDLFIRWRWLDAGDLSSYLELGSGIIESSSSIPPNGTHFNFVPQIGVGLTMRVVDQTRLMIGSRWLHVSNGGLSSQDINPGYDGVMIYAGMLFAF